ncbi:MAG: SCO family protein [Betaproteobacteria bacterium AqS2]|uniref:SCO family protein n=1 Tax=Candidatus Amphirhobacter heronislandensis TaxID=1732024 RepID=A0A930UFH7_9GAMM|nr:SCO family protein [Betaproteobacteria bacterium AqS2]
MEIRRRTAAVLLAALLLAGPAAHGHSVDHELVQGNITGLGHIGGDFGFIDDDGQLRRLSDFRGAPVLLFFGFANCPDVCPGFLAKASAVRRELGDAGAALPVIFVTVDPARDDRERLRRYLALFGDGFVGARVPDGELAEVMRQYAVAAQRVRDEDGKIVITHGSGAYLIDAAGGTAAYISTTRSVAEIAAQVAALLQ